jgi:hypothetical protein
VVLNIDFYLLLGRQVFDDWGNLEPAGLEVRHENLENEVFVGVVADDGGGLHELSHLQRRQIDLVLREREIRTRNFAYVVQLELGGGDFACNRLADDLVLLSEVLAVTQFAGIEDEVRLNGLEGQELQEGLVILNGDVLLEVE